MEGTKSTALALGALGLIVGGIVGYAMNGGESKTVTSVSDPVAALNSDAADVRVALNNALREHVSVSAGALRAAASGSADTEALLETVDSNSIEVAALVGSVYGAEAEETFLSSWRSHIGFFVDYLNAKVAGDEAGMQQAIDDLAGYAQAAGAFFEGANPNLPASATVPMIAMHRDQVIAVIDAYAAGNIAESYELEQEARDHMNGFADALANGIITQQAEN